MLVLQRRIGERVMIGDDIVIEVLDVFAGKVRLGVTCPRETRVDREEVRRRIERERLNREPGR